MVENGDGYTYISYARWKRCYARRPRRHAMLETKMRAISEADHDDHDHLSESPARWAAG